jgi:hypothetical protein
LTPCDGSTSLYSVHRLSIYISSSARLGRQLKRQGPLIVPDD